MPKIVDAYLALRELKESKTPLVGRAESTRRLAVDTAREVVRSTIGRPIETPRYLRERYAPRDTREDYAPPDVEGITVTAPRLTQRQRERRQGERERRQFRPILEAVERAPAFGKNLGRGLAAALEPSQLAQTALRSFPGSPQMIEMTGAPGAAREVARGYAAERRGEREEGGRRGASGLAQGGMAAALLVPELAAVRGARGAAAASRRVSNLRGIEQSSRIPSTVIEYGVGKAPRGIANENNALIATADGRRLSSDEYLLVGGRLIERRLIPRKDARNPVPIDELEETLLKRGFIEDIHNLRGIEQSSRNRWTLKYSTDINRWELSGPTGRRTFENKSDAVNYAIRNNISAREIKPNTGQDLSDWVSERRTSRNQQTALQREHDDQLRASGSRPATMDDVISEGRQSDMFPRRILDKSLGTLGVDRVGEGLPLLSAGTIAGAAAGAALAPQDAEAAVLDRPEGMPPVLEAMFGAGVGFVSAAALGRARGSLWSVRKGARIDRDRGGDIGNRLDDRRHNYMNYIVPLDPRDRRGPSIYVDIENIDKGSRRHRTVMWGVDGLNTSGLSRAERVSVGRKAMEIVEDVMREDARRFRPSRYYFAPTSQSRRRLYKGSAERAADAGYVTPKNSPDSLRRTPAEALRQTASAAAGPVAGATALVLSAGEAEAQERRPIEAARQRVTELEGIERSLGSGSVLDKQNALIDLGYNVKPDGDMGPDTERYIAQARARNDASLATARNELRNLQREEVSRKTRATPGEQAAREIGPNVAGLAGLALGLGSRFLMTRGSAAGANRLLTAGPVVRGRDAAARRRMGNINEFWRRGGAGERVPFMSAQTERGFKVRPNAAHPSTLYPKRTFRLGDVGVVGGGLGDVAVTQIYLADAERELTEARAAVRRDPGSEDARVRLRTAEDQVAWLRGFQRLGGGLALSHGVSALKLPYQRPNIGAAESELAELNRFLAPRRRRARAKKKAP